jgi:RNA polymerase sigma factor (sigma-70 family)
MSTELLTAEELSTASKVGHVIGSKWSAVDAEDVTAELYLWLVKHVHHVERWRSEPHGKAKLYVTLRREAAKYCAREQAVSNGAPLRQNRVYTVEVLERALPYVWEETPQTVVAEHPMTGQPLNVPYEANLAVSVMGEIRSEFYGLPADLKHCLTLRFRDGLTYEEIAPLIGLTKDGALKRVQRGLSRLSDLLTL